MMPHRILNNIKFHLLYSAMLLVILFGALPLFQTIANVLFRGNIILNILAIWILVGFYYAFPEKIRLDRDSEQMRLFRKDTPDGSYNAKEDAKRIFHSDEYKSDVVSILGTVAAAVLIIFVLFMLRIATPPAILKILLFNPAAFLLIIPAALMLTVSYAAFHLWFTVDVHKGWDETRLHLENERHMEYDEKKK
ncbi:MAG: hypothetical protein MJ175_03975 [Clostridia bacterium]|nr:hypothetical protein [Clostridia bacterium]